MMFLCSLTVFIIILGNCSAQSIKPVNETQLHAFKDETVTISYKYEGATILYWYRQYPGSRPEYFLTIVPKKGATSEPNPLFPQFSSTVDFSESRVNLIISSTAVSDSALYYCALEPTVTETHQILY
ncbi:immunoglobulin iota chain-like [Astyanax mexicanus]|nr:immunoglobulin iota chain-like [Astyanax mexicanus]